MAILTVSNNQKYPSKYSNGKTVSAAQFITEIICERKAQYDKEDLHFRFWLQKKWSSFYRNQIGSAHKLLKNYNASSIIRALNSDEGRKIYSLRAPHLPAIIEKHQATIETENTNLSIDIQRKQDIKFHDTALPKKKNIVSKLKGLDNES